MDEVGSPVDGVDDPSGIISQNAGGARRYRLFAYKAEKGEKEKCPSSKHADDAKR